MIGNARATVPVEDAIKGTARNLTDSETVLHVLAASLVRGEARFCEHA